MGLSAVGTTGVVAVVVVSEETVDWLTVAFGISASLPGVERVFAKSPVKAPREPVVMPT